jgi:hypothetical protein
MGVVWGLRPGLGVKYFYQEFRVIGQLRNIGAFLQNCKRLLFQEHNVCYILHVVLLSRTLDYPAERAVAITGKISLIQQEID